MYLPFGLNNLNTLDTILLIAVLLYLAGVLLEPWGLILGYIISLFGMPFAGFEKGLRIAIKWLYEHSSSHFTEVVHEHQDKKNRAYGIVVLSLLGAAVLLGDLVTLIVVLPYIIGTGAGVLNAGVLTYASLIVFFGSIILIAEQLFELWGLSDVEVRLIPKMPQHWLGKVLLSLVFVVFLLIGALNFVLIGFLKAYLLRYGANSPNTENVQGLILILTSIMVVGAGYVGFRALLRSFQGFLSFWMLFFAGVCGVFFIISWLITQPFHWLAYLPSRGQISPYSVIPKPVALSGGTSLQLPWWRKPDEQDIVQPLAITGGTLMRDDKVTAVLFGGTDGGRAFAAFDKAKQELQAPVRASGYVNTLSEDHLVIQGTVDVGPTPEDKAVIMNNNGARGDEITRQLYEHMGHKTEEECLKVSYLPGPLYAVIDKYDLPQASSMLRRLASSLPHNSALLITFIAQHEYGTPIVESTLNLIAELHRDKAIAAALILDESALAHADLFVHTPRALMKLLRLKKDYPYNRNAVEMLDVFSRSGSPLIAVRHDSDTIASSGTPRHWWERLLGMNKDAGNVSNMITRTQQLIDSVFMHPEKGTVPAPIPSGVPSFILTTLPIPRPEKQKLNNYARLIDTYVSRRYAPAYVLYARTTGEPTRERRPTEYMVSVSWFFTVLTGELTQPPALLQEANRAGLPEPKAAPAQRQAKAGQPGERVDSSEEVEEDKRVPLMLSLKELTNIQPLQAKELDELVRNFKRWEKHLAYDWASVTGSSAPVDNPDLELPIPYRLAQIQGDKRALEEFVNINLAGFRTHATQLFTQPTVSKHAFFVARFGYAVRAGQRLLGIPEEELLPWSPLMQQLLAQVSDPELIQLVKEDMASQPANVKS